MRMMHMYQLGRRVLAFERGAVFSRGRFSVWKYEASNQDRSFAQGYERIVRCLWNGGSQCDPTLFTPHVY